MSVTKADQIDGLTGRGDTLVLAVSDHLRWDMEQPAHLKILQDKLNTYIRFFESGEYRDHLDGQTFDKCLIEVYFLHEPHESFEKMISLVGEQLSERHITIKSIYKPT